MHDITILTKQLIEVHWSDSNGRWLFGNIAGKSDRGWFLSSHIIERSCFTF